jgi:hypothetical protein
MRPVIIFSCIALCCTQSNAQWGRLPSSVEISLQRIEQALRTGSPGSIEDLLNSGITMRLEDSLYQSISSIYALGKLKKYFSDKDSIDFRFGLPGSGSMTFSQDGKRDTVNVDVWLKRSPGGTEVYALNISNYPLATVFFDIPRRKNEKQ